MSKSKVAVGKDECDRSGCRWFELWALACIKVNALGGWNRDKKRLSDFNNTHLSPEPSPQQLRSLYVILDLFVTFGMQRGKNPYHNVDPSRCSPNLGTIMFP